MITLAADLFDQRGYASVSMEQIAAAAAIAKPTLHHYFRAKDEIRRGIHETFIELLLERQDERIRLGLAPADQLLGAMTDIFGLMETHRGHVRVFFEHHRELPDAARQEIRIKRDRYEQLIHDAVTEGIGTGVFRDVDPDGATLAIFGICYWAYQWWRPGSAADPRAHRAEDVGFDHPAWPSPVSGPTCTAPNFSDNENRPVRTLVSCARRQHWEGDPPHAQQPRHRRPGCRCRGARPLPARRPGTTTTRGASSPRGCWRAAGPI